MFAIQIPKTENRNTESPNHVFYFNFKTKIPLQVRINLTYNILLTKHCRQYKNTADITYLTYDGSRITDYALKCI